LQLAAVERWSDLSKPLANPKPVPNRTLLERYLALTFDTGKSAKEIADGFDAKDPQLAVEPPAPPPDDEETPSTTHVDPFGRMGRMNDPFEAERVQRMNERWQLLAVTGNAGPQQPIEIDGRVPSRLAKQAGEVMLDGKLPRVRALVFADPSLKATQLIDVLHASSGAIGVVHQKELRALRVAFERDPDSRPASPDVWFEARLSMRGVAIEAVPGAAVDVPWGNEPLDPDAITRALLTVRREREVDQRAPIDVLVDPDVDVQRLLDLLVVLDATGPVMIGLGDAASDGELAKRGKRIPSITIGNPARQGGLDGKTIRNFVKEAEPKLYACYEKAPAKTPKLAGQIYVSFYIRPDGDVVSATANGFDTSLAICFQTVIGNLAFPKPDGEGGVQVGLPLALRY
jgi:hypothetical protein